MANFSTNQVKHLYVAKAVDSNLDTLGDIKFTAVGDNQIAAKYVGNDGVVRTDLINLATLKGKAVKASTMDELPTSAYVGVTGKTYSDDAVAGQQYIIKVIVNEFAGMTAEDKGFIFADYSAATGDKVKNVLANLALSLAKNASKAAANQLIKVYVTTQATVTSVAAANCTEVTPSTAISSLSGDYVGIVIEGAAQPWNLGRMASDKVLFDVAATPIISSGIQTSWATITKNVAHVASATKNSKKIADLEYFCAGERGDIYRNVGWPNSFDFKPIVNPEQTYGYDIIELTWDYQGDAEDIQKSPKELVIAVPAPASYSSSTASYLVVADINTAAGSTVVTQVFGS